MISSGRPTQGLSVDEQVKLNKKEKMIKNGTYSKVSLTVDEQVR